MFRFTSNSKLNVAVGWAKVQISAQRLAIMTDFLCFYAFLPGTFQDNAITQAMTTSFDLKASLNREE